MKTNGTRETFRVEKGALRPSRRGVVQEYPINLTVNDREIATLIASPHRLNFLIAGFLRLQGFVESLDEILTLGVCSDFGAARVRIEGEVPERLKPTLTSGCGTGICFHLPGEAPAASPSTDRRAYSVDSVLNLMKDLAGAAENYRAHGGIHSAAVGDGEKLLLFSEDLGRHNTLDRIAGEAMFREIDLEGKMLVTSGRISTEMVGKAARLGIEVIASRTSPTDMALRMAEEAGITLIGYVRGESFEIYCHPERIGTKASADKIRGVTGIILAGGESRRMGCNKSLLPVNGARFIDHIHRTLSELFEEVVLVTNTPGLYDDIDCRKVPDIYHAQGALAGIHSGLCHAAEERSFVVACDMPFLSPEVVRAVCEQAEGTDVIIPRSASGLEPLHALYHKRCLPAMEAQLDRGGRKIVGFFPEVAVREISGEELLRIDPEAFSFRNVNTPEEYFHLRGRKEGGCTLEEEPPLQAGRQA